MRLLLVNYEYPPVGGGAATATRAMARCFVRMGHSVTVLTTGLDVDAGERSEDGVRVIRLETGRSRTDRASMREMLAFAGRGLVRLLRTRQDERPEGAIVFFSVPCGPLASVLEVRHRVPTIVSLRGGDVPGFLPELDRMHAILAPIRRHCLRHARAVVANSPSLAALAQDADGGTVHMIPNGVDTDAFHPAPRRAEGGFELLFVGRLTEQKRLALVMETLGRLRRETAGGEELRLSVVGDGPLREPLHAAAERLGIARQVVWHGWVSRDRLGELYRAADCYVQASNIEGMSNTVLEAMASGLPVIASDGPGNRDVVVDGRNGLVFAVDDREALFQAIRRLHGDRELAAMLGRAARSDAMSKYSWDASARAYLALFDRSEISTSIPASAPTIA